MTTKPISRHVPVYIYICSASQYIHAHSDGAGILLDKDPDFNNSNPQKVPH